MTEKFIPLELNGCEYADFEPFLTPQEVDEISDEDQVALDELAAQYEDIERHNEYVLAGYCEGGF